MKIPIKKLRSGFEMPVFGFGTWEIGGGVTHNPDNDDERDIEAIRRALDAGITHIDTAEKYADGYAEVLVGKAIEGYDRSKLFITSKVAKIHHRYDDLITSCYASLKRLQVEYLDLYLLHSPSLDIPMEETFRALDDLIKYGVIKHMGVSNFAPDRLKEAQSLTRNKIVTDQVQYNLRYREPERKNLLNYCQENDVFLTAYRPIEKNRLSPENDIMQEMMKKYNKTHNQIAINWLIAQENVIVINKTVDKKHFEENLGALGWELEKEDVERLRRDFPGQEDISGNTPLV